MAIKKIKLRLNILIGICNDYQGLMLGSSYEDPYNCDVINNYYLLFSFLYFIYIKIDDLYQFSTSFLNEISTILFLTSFIIKK